jgi:hypothetical protein
MHQTNPFLQVLRRHLTGGALKLFIAFFLKREGFSAIVSESYAPSDVPKSEHNRRERYAKNRKYNRYSCSKAY